MIENSGVPESSEGGHSMLNENTAKGHLPGINDKIHDLIEIVDEPHGRIYDLVDAIEESGPLPKEKPQEVLIIDGRAYKKEKQSDVKIHDLVDIVGEESISGQQKFISEDEMMMKIVETVEKMAREMIPDIVERIIREEIEKLKQETEEDVH